ncbi:coiled-coil domain-containing protein [Thermococcus gorgonarius]|uniref:Uncharacterized protein n=1 Tax=Thermococcus gorgonarius TaxID=71997 RepID=A0A2Z2M3M1_THEGO|nr:hypothetical protein [Thermococcus gorgonarius]ASJ00237.1 hypothetical protein A3K92_01440 [Thermococcus gorgonarius]
MKWVKALVVLTVLVGSLIPAGMSLAAENTSTQIEAYSPVSNTTNTTPEKELAERIINIVEKLHNITERLLQNATLPENSSVMEHYSLAEEYRERAETAYQNGDYPMAVTEGLLAMHQYKEVLKSIKNAREEVRVSMERMRGYFEAAQRTIAAAEKAGLDTSKAKELLNETKEAYLQVVEDIKEKNIEKAKEDLEKARELKKELDAELRELRKELAYAHSDKIVNAFLAKGEKAMAFVENVISKANETDRNTTELQERLDAFRALYDQVKELADQGNYTAALTLIHENRETVREFYKAVGFILREARERVVEEKMKDLKAFGQEVQERIRKDSRALEKLKREGVDVKGAELKLRTAIQEFKLGFELAKRGRPKEAKAHFGIGLGLLQDVEKFIVAHS